MKTIDLRQPLPQNPLIRAIIAMIKANDGDNLEFIFDDPERFHDIKELLSEINIGFREVYEEDQYILQFTIKKPLTYLSKEENSEEMSCS